MPNSIDVKITWKMNAYRKILVHPGVFKAVHRDMKQSFKTGICIGCFDIIHSGHLLHLLEAKNRCGKLFVVITADVDIDKPGRPYFSQESRLKQIALLEPVDYCCIRPEGIRADRFLSEIKPDFYFKGSDYAESQSKELISEAEAVKLSGGEVLFTQAPCPCHSSELVDYFLNREA